VYIPRNTPALDWEDLFRNWSRLTGFSLACAVGEIREKEKASIRDKNNNTILRGWTLDPDRKLLVALLLNLVTSLEPIILLPVLFDQAMLTCKINAQRSLEVPKKLMASINFS